jgi:MOB kinase activator 1
MSGFISTMFVSPAAHVSHVYPPFPPKPRPLQPIFTFAQSQSCMNLGMHLADPTLAEPPSSGPKKEGLLETCENWLEAIVPAKPQLAYKSPLQRIGEALRAPQTPSVAILPVQDTEAGAAALQLHCVEPAPVIDFPNYSYKLLPGGKSPPIPTNLSRHSHSFAQSENGSRQSGTVSSPDSRARLHAQQHNGYFAGGTRLLSSLFSNPRPRAPFKPQKTGRGTSSWQLKQYAEATLGSGSLRKAVKLPEGEDKDEWLAVNGEKFDGMEEMVLTG